MKRPPAADSGGEPSASGENSSPPKMLRPVPEQPPPPRPSVVPDLGEDLVFEVLLRAEPRTLAAAACVSRSWRRMAADERLWEAVCVRDWAALGCDERQLRSVVLAMGGFRRLHAQHLRPLHARGGYSGGRRRRWGREEVMVSLSMMSTAFFGKLAAGPSGKRDKNDGGDRNPKIG